MFTSDRYIPHKKYYLRNIGDPILRKKSSEVTNFSASSIDPIVEAMEAELDKGAVGMSAPQVGADKRIIATNIFGQRQVYFNPVITRRHFSVPSPETCRSIPGIHQTKWRKYLIKIDYKDKYGIAHQSTYTGFHSFAIQHEIDHLNGILIID